MEFRESILLDPKFSLLESITKHRTRLIAWNLQVDVRIWGGELQKLSAFPSLIPKSGDHQIGWLVKQWKHLNIIETPMVFGESRISEDADGHESDLL